MTAVFVSSEAYTLPPLNEILSVNSSTKTFPFAQTSLETRLTRALSAPIVLVSVFTKTFPSNTKQPEDISEIFII